MRKTSAQKIILVGGARPNFMKIAPVLREIKKYKKHFRPILVHTGQHYDYKMSKIFFRDLGIPKPDIYLGVGSGSHAVQTAKIMTAFEKVCLDTEPDIVMVAGDVNSTLACAVVAAKLNINIAHIEAGLRSFDRTMPEEINRIVTDSLTDYYFTTCSEADRNLKHEGVPSSKIFFVGNVMIDSLRTCQSSAKRLKTLNKLKLTRKGYSLLTLHRPVNVDSKESLTQILEILTQFSNDIPVLFPAHPRTQARIESFRLGGYFKQTGLRMIDPIGYLDFLNLMINCKFVLTDSGGIQEETTALKIPCLTMRENTERAITAVKGSNTLVGTDKTKILKYVNRILQGNYKTGRLPKYWDGKAAARLVRALKQIQAS